MLGFKSGLRFCLKVLDSLYIETFGIKSPGCIFFCIFVTPLRAQFKPYSIPWFKTLINIDIRGIRSIRIVTTWCPAHMLPYQPDLNWTWTQPQKWGKRGTGFSSVTSIPNLSPWPTTNDHLAGVNGWGFKMQAHLSFLLLLLFSGKLTAAQTTECCKEKFTYTDDGRIKEMFVLVGEQESGASAACQGGCVFVRSAFQ